jgi:broad specificity phosphatase PhoE
MREVHLVRHGRTAWNVEHRVMGRLDEGIDDDARADAEAVAGVLAGRGVTEIVTSPMRRARQTAAPLAALLDLEPRPDERAAELRVSAWEGLTEDEVALRWPEDWDRWRTEPHALDIEGRETLAELGHRMADLLDELTGASTGGAAVVFTHDAPIRAAVAWALGTGPEIYRHVEVANCSITTVGAGGGTRRLLRANDTAHLRGP